MEIMSFNINVFNSDSHFVQRRVNTCAILKDGYVGNIYVKLFRIWISGLG